MYSNKINLKIKNFLVENLSQNILLATFAHLDTATSLYENTLNKASVWTIVIKKIILLLFFSPPTKCQPTRLKFGSETWHVKTILIVKIAILSLINVKPSLNVKYTIFLTAGKNDFRLSIDNLTDFWKRTPLINLYRLISE